MKITDREKDRQTERQTQNQSCSGGSIRIYEIGEKEKIFFHIFSITIPLIYYLELRSNNYYYCIENERIKSR